MIRPVKLGVASLKGLGAVVVLGTLAHAGSPYLPRIGPPPLRVEEANSHAAVKAAAVPTPVVTNQPPVAQTEPAPLSTNTPSLVAKPAAAPVVPPVAESPAGALGDTFTSSVFPIPAPDLLGISPEVLANYFHPVQSGTNLPGVAGPFQVIFMPPMPPEKSSHAEYIVK